MQYITKRHIIRKTKNKLATIIKRVVVLLGVEEGCSKKKYSSQNSFAIRLTAMASVFRQQVTLKSIYYTVLSILLLGTIHYK